jgi:hypothetical protein
MGEWFMFNAKWASLTLYISSLLTDVMYFSDMRYCEVIINHGVLIFADFVVDLNHENKNPTKYYFPIDCCMYCLKPRIQVSMDQCIL